MSRLEEIKKNRERAEAEVRAITNRHTDAAWECIRQDIPWLVEQLEKAIKSLNWYADNGMRIDVSYMQGKTLVNKWIDVSPKAKAALKSINVEVSTGEKT